MGRAQKRGDAIGTTVSLNAHVQHIGDKTEWACCGVRACMTTANVVPTTTPREVGAVPISSVPLESSESLLAFAAGALLPRSLILRGAGICAGCHQTAGRSDIITDML